MFRWTQPPRGIALLDSARANLKFAFRMMRKSPSFSIAVILTLAIGVGANSAVFSALDAVLIRPLPYPAADRLMLLRQYNLKLKNPLTNVAPARLEDWNRMSASFEAITGYYTDDTSETSGALPEKITLALVAPRFLEVMGVAPALGRDFSPAEEVFGGPHGVLIGDRFWRSRFGGDPAAIGKNLRIEGASDPIIGVMPPSFEFPDRSADVWSPVPPDAPVAQNRESTWYTVIGRLRPGVTPDRARANLATVQAQLGREYPKTDAALATGVEPLKDASVGSARRSLWLLFGSVSLLLLICCINVAALLLARGAQRRQEIAIRFALGATRGKIAAQMLTEVLVLALAGAIPGLAIAAAASRIFRTLAANFPRVAEIHLDGRIVLYSLCCAIAATILCGLLPALRGTSGLQSGSSRTQVSFRNPLQWILVGAQVALAVTLLTGAGLLIRSFQELGRVSPGFDPNHVLTLHITWSYAETADMQRLTNRIDGIIQALSTVLGVEAAADSSQLPGDAGPYQSELKLVEGHADTAPKMLAESRFVSPDYFKTMRIPMLAGETCREDSPSVVVNRSFANAYLAGSPAIGHHLQGPGVFMGRPSEIRGIAGDARELGLDHEPVPTVYWCASAANPGAVYLIRTRGEPMAMAETLRRKIHQIEPARSVFDIEPLAQRLDASFAENRLRMILLAFFAITAISLACIGLYGTLSYLVNVRRREVGLRLALGATQRQIVSRFFFQGMGVSLAGCAMGLALASGFARLIAGMLYGVSPSDAITWSAVAALVLSAAAGASLIPAIRASRVEPMQVLRDE